MTYKVLSLKWRPKTFNEVIGQNHITLSLSNAIELNRVAHAFTFSGPRGVGKTTTARILSQELNQVKDIDESFDIIEMDAASNRGIDEIRNLNNNVHYAPSHGKYKIYIIDEVHMLTKEAFNALLKTLEEPPEHVVFILCTTELHKMPTTILSRTQRFDFKRISNSDIVERLMVILKEEGLEHDSKCLEIIAERSEGSMRDALSLLDQMICLCGNHLSYDIMKKHLGLIDDKQFISLLNLIGLKDSKKIFVILEDILSSGVSIEEFIKSFNKFLCSIITNQSNLSSSIEVEEVDLLRIIDLTLKFQSTIKNHSQPQIALEVLLLKLSYLDKMVDISMFLEKSHGYDDNDDGNIPKNEQKKEYDEKDKKSIPSEQISKQNKNLNKEYSKEKNEPSTTIIKENGIDTKKENLVDENNVIDENVDLNQINLGWKKILKIIEQKNSKTAGFLEDIILESFNEGNLKIEINNISNFIFKGLLNDIKLIEDSLFDFFKSRFKVTLHKGKISENKIKKNKNEQKDHPLFMDALNKFKGEVLR